MWNIAGWVNVNHAVPAAMVRITHMPIVLPMPASGDLEARAFSRLSILAAVFAMVLS